MDKIKAVSYEERRLEYFKKQRDSAERRMNYWCRPKQADRVGWMEASDRASEAGMQYNFYKDALEALEKQPKWISVEDEQKPRHGKRYLCVCTLSDDSNHEWDWLMVLEWHCRGGNGYVDRPHFTDEGVEGMTVTHWMPLPPVPEEDHNA